MCCIIRKNNEVSSDDAKTNKYKHYIRKFYDTKFDYKGLDIEAKYVEQTKDYIEAILLYLRSKIYEFDSEMGFSRFLNMRLEIIAHGIRYCPDGQMAAIEMAYFGLLKNEKLPEETLDSFTDMFIAREKLYFLRWS